MGALICWSYTHDILDLLHIGTPQKHRDELQVGTINPIAPIRILTASMHCGGVDLNSQNDSHVCMLF